MPILTREQILATPELLTETVPVPEWGGEVIVKALSGAERDRFEAGCMVQKGKRQELRLENIRARLVALSVVDEQGRRMFSEGDVVALGRKFASALAKIYDAACRLSGITDQDIEELEKNSLSGQSDDSGTS